MFRWWMVVGLVSTVALADPSEGVPPPFEYFQQTTRDLRVEPTDASVPYDALFELLVRQPDSPPARAVLLYVSEVRTPGNVNLRIVESGAVASVAVSQPGWQEWVLPQPLKFATFSLDTASADVTIRFSTFEDRYELPTQRHSRGYVRSHLGPSTGVLRLVGGGHATGCAAPNDDLVTGLPYVDTSRLPAGTFRQRVRLHTDWNDTPFTPFFEFWPIPSRITSADGRQQSPDDGGTFSYAVSDLPDGGLSSPFVLEYASDGGNVWAARSFPPDPCHPVARAGFDGDESRWLEGPAGADLAFRIVPWRTTQNHLDLDGDGAPGPTFEWRLEEGSPATDCDDADAARRPGLPERCNGRDDDCDGVVDGPHVVRDRCERSAGICAPIAHQASDCQNGAWISCEALGRYPVAFSPEELRCDGVDEDCDGVVDDAPPPVSCPLTQGVCAGSRTQTCTAASWAACDYGSGYELTESSCDGLDNDCDGLLDAADLDVPQSACELQQGVCANTVHARAGCTATGWAACTRTEYGTNFQQNESRCDGLDNDCDGLTDADDTDLDGAPCEKQLGVCAGSKHVRSDCSAGSWKACGAERFPTTWEATESRCDGLDNDCDGITDEGCRAAPLPSARPEPTNQGCTCATAGGLDWMIALIIVALARRRG